MAINIFPCRESIWYASKPTNRYGWRIVTSGDGRSITYLDSAAGRKVLTNLVFQRMKKAGFSSIHGGGYPGEMEACFVLAEIIGGDDRDWAREVITDVAPNNTKLWTFLMGLSEDQEILKVVSR